MRTRFAALALALVGIGNRAEANSCIPGFDYAAFAKNSLHFQGNAGTDSYDSSVGTYAATQVCGDSDIGTNATTAGAVHVQSSSTTICGDVSVGSGGSPATVFTGNGNVTGTKTALSANLALTNPTAPVLANNATFNIDFKNEAGTMTANRTYGTVACKNGSITFPAGQYVMASLTLTTNCELNITGGAVEIYFTSAVDIQAGVVTNTSGVAGNLILYGTGTATSVHAQGGATSAFAVYAPTAACELHGNADLYGAMVCATVESQGNAHIHYDRALMNKAGGGFACTATNETSRATPIIATIDNQPTVVQGTYEPPGALTSITSIASIATFTFPLMKGHMRARATSSIGTTASLYSSGNVIFDAGATGKIPAPNNSGCNSFDGTCRNLFTVTQVPGANGISIRPPRVQFNDTNASTIGALIASTTDVVGIGATQWQTITRRVLAAGLGGVDRSTVAVIGPSAVAGLGTRPTIAYFGSTDGMLHAVCASVGGSTASDTNICPGLGTELWAFMPRTQLSRVRTNTTRLDGSPRVVDAFGDFAGTGTKSFRTILTFQSGSENALYSLDITDPANPSVVWEVTAPSPKAANDLGVGLALASGTVLVGGVAKNVVVAETNNGGTGATGMVATALDLETGEELWQYGYQYPSPPRGVAADLPLPTTGIPGGAVGVDLANQGYVTEFVMGDLYGNLWRLDAATGASKTGTNTPLFQFSTNKKPIGAIPAIFSDGNAQYAVFGSGGYADPSSASWKSGNQVLIGIKLTEVATYPIAETATSSLTFKHFLGAGESAYAQALVVGDEIFLATDTADVNQSAYGTAGATGHVISWDLSTANTTSVVSRGGASSIAASGTTLFSSSSDGQQQLSAAAASTTGVSVDSGTVAKLKRRLWLRTE